MLSESGKRVRHFASALKISELTLLEGSQSMVEKDYSYMAGTGSFKWIFGGLRGRR